jgi:hypothetical protein
MSNEDRLVSHHVYTAKTTILFNFNFKYQNLLNINVLLCGFPNLSLGDNIEISSTVSYGEDTKIS